jgi:hypothetical protein
MNNLVNNHSVLTEFSQYIFWQEECQILKEFQKLSFEITSNYQDFTVTDTQCEFKML